MKYLLNSFLSHFTCVAGYNSNIYCLNKTIKKKDTTFECMARCLVVSRVNTWWAQIRRLPCLNIKILCSQFAIFLTEFLSKFILLVGHFSASSVAHTKIFLYSKHLKPLMCCIFNDLKTEEVATSCKGFETDLNDCLWMTHL